MVFVHYITDFIKFLNRNSIDHNDEAYDHFASILAVLSFHRKTTMGKCMLHNVPISSVVHVSLEAYVFIYLKGKMQLSPEVNTLFEASNVDTNKYKQLLESVKKMSDVVHFVGKAKKGENLSKERNGAKDKLVWTWTQPIYDTYKRLMGELKDYNRQFKKNFIFDDLTNEELANYERKNRLRKEHHGKTTPVKDRGECVRTATNLLTPELHPATNADNESDDESSDTWSYSYEKNI
jgi:hypothetical protein